jgi:integrase
MEREHAPIRVEPGVAGRLIVRLPYTPERVAKIKTVDGRRWHGPEKYWSIPHEEDSIARLKSLFTNESIEFDATFSATASSNAENPAAVVLGKMSAAIRARHLSPRTEECYLGWTRRFLIKAGPLDGIDENAIGRFLSDLAVKGHVSASTQNQALNALLFFCQHGLGRKIGLVDGVVRAKRPERLPVVLSKDEVRKVLGRMSGAPKLMAMLLYGSGLRLMECCNLRVKDLDWDQHQLVVRSGKGGKDRYTTLPSGMRESLKRHLADVQRQHLEDLAKGLGRVELPNALARKYPNADTASAA